MLLWPKFVYITLLGYNLNIGIVVMFAFDSQTIFYS